VILGKKKRKKKGQSEQAKKPLRSISLTPDIVEGLKEQFRRFEEKFGRPAGPDDPIFFDPAADEPRPMIDEVIDQHMLEAMHKAKTHPAIIHAYQTTGRLVTKENRKNLTKAQLREWTDAIAEWHRTHDE
jgi:hypothetical protein